MKFAQNLWKNIKAYFTDTNSEFRLASKPLPELYELKSAHQELFQAYAESLAAVSRLSFFVKKNEVEPSVESRFFEIFRKIIWSGFSPLRLFIWRPIVGFYLEAHIYTKLKELEKAYTLASYLPTDNSNKEKKLKDWLQEAKDDSKHFLAAIGAGKLFRDALEFLSLTLINIVFVTWGANNFSEFILYFATSTPATNYLNVLIKITLFILLMLPFSLTFIDAAFSAKRAILIHINKKGSEIISVYQLENTLFNFLGFGKTKEFPIDISVLAFAYSIPIFFIWSFHMFVKELAKYSNTIVCDISWCFLLPLLGIFGTDVIIPWARRNQKGEM